MVDRSWRFWVVAAIATSLAQGPVAQESFDELWKKSSALSQKGDYAAAIPELRNARALAPQNYAVNLLLGLDLLRIGRPDEALEPLRAAVDSNPQDGTANGYLGKTLAAMKLYSAAAESFHSAVSRSPNSQELWAELADFAMERFRQLALRLRRTQNGMAAMLRVSARASSSGSESPEELLRRSALANPTQPGIWGELGVEQLRNGKREAAASSLRTARTQQSGDAWTLRLEAMLAAAQGDWRSAEVWLLKLGGRSPAMLRETLQSWPAGLQPPSVMSSGIWRCVRDYSRECLAGVSLPQSEVSTQEDVLFSEERWEQLAALPVSSEGVPSSFRHGVALAEMDECGLAIPLLESGLEVEADTAAFWLEVCYASDARRAIARIKTLGNLALFHRLQGDALVRINGDAQSATEEYRQALLVRPRDPGVLERLAQAYFSFGDWDQAQKAAQSALSIDPQRPLALHVLASISLEEKNYPDALVLLNKALAIQANDPWTRVQLGVAYSQVGQQRQALDFLQPMLEAGYPDERGALHATLAGIFRKLGREQESATAAAEAGRLSDLFQQHRSQSTDGHP